MNSTAHVTDVEPTSVAVYCSASLISYFFSKEINSFQNHFVTGNFSDSKLAETALKGFVPHIAFIEYEFDQFKGLRLAETISTFYPECRIIAFSAVSTELKVLQMINAGARAFLNTNSSIAELPEAIRKVKSGLYYFNNILTAQHRDYVAENKHDKNAMFNVVFDAELLNILMHIRNRKTYKEISKIIPLTASTISKRVCHYNQIFGCKATGLIKIAEACGKM